MIVFLKILFGTILEIAIVVGMLMLAVGYAILAVFLLTTINVWWHGPILILMIAIPFTIYKFKTKNYKDYENRNRN